MDQAEGFVNILQLTMNVCIGVGILFGVAPGFRAARQRPIDASRYE